jgi:hypothetical protein
MVFSRLAAYGAVSYFVWWRLITGERITYYEIKIKGKGIGELCNNKQYLRLGLGLARVLFLQQVFLSKRVFLEILQSSFDASIQTLTQVLLWCVLYISCCYRFIHLFKKNNPEQRINTIKES